MTTPKQTSSVHDIGAEKPPFGSRFLTDESQVWTQNAWDHVPPPDDQEETIARSLARQRAAPVSEEDKEKYNSKPAKHWDNFYKANASNFFRNRKWLHNEFPELTAVTKPDAGPTTVAEIGCGAGNALFPLLSANENPNLNLFGFDYSSHAVKLVQNNSLYRNPPCGTVQAAVWDLASESGLPLGIDPGSVDIVTLVFVLSALHPAEWGQAVKNIHQMLKPGGLVLLRDYGRHDLTQLRFKGGRLLEDNFYVRGDKTRVYFFQLEELAYMFTGSHSVPRGLPEVPLTTTPQLVDDEEGGDCSPPPSNFTSGSASVSLSTGNEPSQILTQGKVAEFTSPSGIPIDCTIISPDDDPANPVAISTKEEASILKADDNATITHGDWPSSGAGVCAPHLPLPPPLQHHRFAAEQLGVDRRLLVNRKRQLKMYRVWMQGKFRKLR